MSQVNQTMKDKNGRDFAVGMKLRSAMFPQVEVKCIDIKDGFAYLSQTTGDTPIMIDQEKLDIAQWEVPHV